MDHNIVFSHNYAKQKGGGDEQMYLHQGPFSWPRGCIEAIRSASLNAAWPGLHQKSLDATIRQLLAPYRPDGCQGGNKQNNNDKCTNLAGHFNGRDGVTVQYRVHHPAEEVHGFLKIH